MANSALCASVFMTGFGYAVSVLVPKAKQTGLIVWLADFRIAPGTCRDLMSYWQGHAYKLVHQQAKRSQATNRKGEQLVFREGVDRLAREPAVPHPVLQK